MNENSFSVSEFIVYCNQTLDYAYADCVIEGEILNIKTSQGKWVFFDLKDSEASISCFIPIWNLRTELEDGMRVQIKGTPKITNFGKFSLTVKNIRPVGEGALKKSFELLKKKLEKEGLFDIVKKRPLPENISKIGVISSIESAGYADFIKILGERWSGLELQVCHTQVQGFSAPDQIIRATNYLNERSEVEIIAILRGGGSADDLSTFNDEKLVRAIAGSKIPVITGIGHEIDQSLSDFAADVIASTPSNVAQLITRDKNTVLHNHRLMIEKTRDLIFRNIANQKAFEEAFRDIKTKIYRELEQKNVETATKISNLSEQIRKNLKNLEATVLNLIKMVEKSNPERILKNGYVILSGKVELESKIKLETLDKNIEAIITSIKRKEKDEK